MTENERNDEQEKPTTSPAGENPSEATTPPGQGDVDEEAVERGQDKLDQAGH